MAIETDILNTLRHGTAEEKGNVLIALARQKDLKYAGALREIMYSSEPFLSVMAAFALGEAGDKAGYEFLEKTLHSASSIYTNLNEGDYSEVVEEVKRLPEMISSTFERYNGSQYTASKEKLLRLLEIYSKDPPRFNIPHFDNLVTFSVKKTRGMILDALSVCEFNLGNIDSAMQYIMAAVTIAEEVGDPQLLKITYGELGHFHISLGNYYSALELLHKSLEIDDGSHDPWRKKNRTLSNLAQLYSVLGQEEKALEYIEQALSLSEEEKDLKGKARCLNGKAVLLSKLHEAKKAEKCFQEALSITINELHNQALQGLILGNLATHHYFSGALEKAKVLLKEALDLAVQIGDKSVEASLLANSAVLELESGNVEEAKKYAEAALDISREIEDPSGLIDAKFILGIIEDQSNDNPYAAFDQYKEAISLSETLRKNLMLDDFKISFAGNHIGIYQQMVSLCVRMGRTEDAFEYIERSKSRAFVDMLASSMDSIDSKTVSRDKLEEVGMLKGKLDVLKRELASAYTSGRQDSDERARDDGQEDLQGQVAELERTYKNTFEELKIKDPEWASLVSVDVSGVNVVQDTLDAGTLLLEFYQLGDAAIIVAVKKDEPPSVISVPIDPEADSERLFNLFMALSEGRGLDTRSHEFIKQVKQPLSEFHDMLISPLAALTEGIEHLVVIPHSFWHYLPFHALYDNTSKKYLIDKFSISYAPSATALALCKRKTPSPLAGEGGGEGNRKIKTVLILANPTCDLPYAEEEADKVKRKFAGAYVFSKEQASLDKLKYHQGDVIHLACHGYFRGDEPLFSHLMFSDSEGKEMPVFMPDIFNLRLNASLVTLSACETGLSHFTVSDELIGMSRAFFYAGASSLLASLWMVNDKSTALLMDKFYEKLLSGENKAKALRSAISEIKAMPEYGHPYFWAPFFLSGNWT